jgi:hypothetical protein
MYNNTSLIAHPAALRGALLVVSMISLFISLKSYVSKRDLDFSGLFELILSTF